MTCVGKVDSKNGDQSSIFSSSKNVISTEMCFLSTPTQVKIYKHVHYNIGPQFSNYRGFPFHFLGWKDWWVIQYLYYTICTNKTSLYSQGKSLYVYIYTLPRLHSHGVNSSSFHESYIPGWNLCMKWWETWKNAVSHNIFRVHHFMNLPQNSVGHLIL